MLTKGKDAGQVLLDPFIGTKEHITLSYLDDVLTFTFSDLDFQGFDNNFYEYQLLGLSEQWIPMEDNNSMTFDGSVVIVHSDSSSIVGFNIQIEDEFLSNNAFRVKSY